MKYHFSKALLCVGAAAGLSAGSVRAQQIYNDTGNYNGYLMGVTNGLQVGNQIVVDSASLTQFSFEYLATTALAANVGVDVRFYFNNGAPVNGYNTPQTLFFDSGWYYNTLGGIQSSPTGNNLTYTTADFAAGALANWNLYNYALPTTFTFTITWTNITPNEIEMPLANNVAGQSTGFYWVNNNGTWSLNSQPNNNPNGNFLVDFSGQVPEPSTFGLAAIGGALLLGIQRLRRKA
jgi:hypothetical protein